MTLKEIKEALKKAKEKYRKDLAELQKNCKHEFQIERAGPEKYKVCKKCEYIK